VLSLSHQPTRRPNRPQEALGRLVMCMKRGKKDFAGETWRKHLECEVGAGRRRRALGGVRFGGLRG